MAKKRLGISSFDLDKKFNSREDAYKYAKRLIEFIRYTCKKKVDKGWYADVMVVISNTKGNSSFAYYENNGKVGRPKKTKKYSEFDLDYYKGNLSVAWHIHIMLVSKPMYAFRELIKDYIDKNWQDVENDNNNINHYCKTYKKNTNIKKAEYFIDQAEDILFCNCMSEDLIPKGYSLKDLYKAYMKSRTALVYCGKYMRSGKWQQKEKIDNNYNKILEFYYQLSEREDKKDMTKFMKKIKFEKIAVNDNKVQNISIRDRFEETYY